MPLLRGLHILARCMPLGDSLLRTAACTAQATTGQLLLLQSGPAPLTHPNRRSTTHTVLLLKHAATLSPSLFQATSKMPPSPWYDLTSCPSSTDQMCIFLSKEPVASHLGGGGGQA